MKAVCLKSLQVYSYRDTLLRSPSRIHFPFIDISSEGRIAYVLLILTTESHYMCIYVNLDEGH